jgi:homocysteine S-methyltransferase
VAASVGPYGAHLADGSEYRGDYGVTDRELRDFHRERWHLFAAGPADLLACETIPSIREVSVLLALLRETPDRQAWISVSCRDAAHLSDGTPLGEVAQLCDAVPNLAALGVNCTRPEFVEPILREFGRHTRKPLLSYPNAGEDYRVESRSWVGPGSTLDLVTAAPEWVPVGARGIGGCCRVGPARIRALRNAVSR